MLSQPFPPISLLSTHASHFPHLRPPHTVRSTCACPNQSTLCRGQARPSHRGPYDAARGQGTIPGSTVAGRRLAGQRRQRRLWEGRVWGWLWGRARGRRLWRAKGRLWERGVQQRPWAWQRVGLVENSASVRLKWVCLQIHSFIKRRIEREHSALLLRVGVRAGLLTRTEDNFLCALKLRCGELQAFICFPACVSASCCPVAATVVLKPDD